MPALLRDRIVARLAEVGPDVDYIRLAAEVLAVRVPNAALAKHLIDQALVIEDRQTEWQRLGQRLRRELPQRPGVYVMRDAGGLALYVGKASNLRRRVTSYFAPGRWRALAPGLPHACSIDYEEVGSELEALLRESELIEQLAPVINVQLAPRAAPKRRSPGVRDVVVVLPSVETDSAELVCARADGDCLRQRTRRNGSDLAVHTRRIRRFFQSVLVVAPASSRAGVVFAWLAGRGAAASRLDPHEGTPRQLAGRLAALLRDPDLFNERIEQRARW
jgi:hypothetical protein